MKPNLAILTTLLPMSPKKNVDLNSTTTLRILHYCALLLTSRNLLTRGPIRHLKVKLQIAIKFDRDLDLLDREPVFPLLAIETGGLLLCDLVLHAARVEGPLGDRIAFSETVGTCPASLEVEVIVAGESASWKFQPVEAFLLLGRAFVVVVFGRVEMARSAVPGRRDLLGSQPGQKKGERSSHSFIKVGKR